jgi:hypothetical protein
MTIRPGQVLKGATLALALSAAITVILPDEASAGFGMGRGMFSNRMGMHSFAGRGSHFHSGGMMRSPMAFGHPRAMVLRAGPVAHRGGGFRIADPERLVRHPVRMAHPVHPKKIGTPMIRDRIGRPHHVRIARGWDGRASRRPRHHEPPPPIGWGTPIVPFSGHAIPIQNVPRTPPAQQATLDTRAPSQPANTQIVQSPSMPERTVMEAGKVVAQEWYDPSTGHTVERRRFGADGKVVEQEFFDRGDGHRTQHRRFDPETGRHLTTEYFDQAGRKNVRVTFDRTGAPDRIDTYDPATGRMTSTLVIDPRTGQVVETGYPDPNNPGGQWKWVQAPAPTVQP